MAEETKGADAPQPAADTAAAGTQGKTYSEEHVKELIAERDKAKARLREIEEAEKKAIEQKAIEEGKVKEILTSREAELAELRKKTAAYEETQKALREVQLSKLTDAVDKEVAVDIQDLAKLTKFVESRTAQAAAKAKTFDDKAQSGTQGLPKFKTIKEFEMYCNDHGIEVV